MDERHGTAAQPDAAPSPPHGSPSILPGIALAALLLGGIGTFLYADWREAHPAPEVPEGVEPMLKVPGVVPDALREASAAPGASAR